MAKLNIGAGEHPLPYYVNIDIARDRSYIDLEADALKLPFRDNTFIEVNCSHCFEHFDWNEGQALLAEVRRVLVPGGIFAVTVPDFRFMVDAYLGRTSILIESPYGVANRMQDLKVINDLFIYSYNQPSHHKYCYDLELLQRACKEAGLTPIGEIDRYKDPRTTLGQPYQVGIEARK